MKVSEIINEVDVVHNKSTVQKHGINNFIEDHKPLKDDMTIRVYSGLRVNRPSIIATVLRDGLSGKERADRLYSYEGNNNPYGLFVTLDFSVAKKFGNHIIEFHTKVSDLEAPIWPTGTWVGQGGMSGIWNSMEDRENARLQLRKELRSHKVESIRDSDRPELAMTLYDLGESQALFTGQLDPNSIRAVWVSNDLTKAPEYTTFTRMSPKQFLKNLELDEPLKKSSKFFKPREIVTVDMLLDKLDAKFNKLGSKDKDTFRQQNLKFLKTYEVDQLERYLWAGPQLDRVKKELERIDIDSSN